MQFSLSYALSTVIIWPQSFLSLHLLSVGYFFSFVIKSALARVHIQYRITSISAGEIRVGCRRAVGDQCSLQQITISLTVNRGHRALWVIIIIEWTLPGTFECVWVSVCVFVYTHTHQRYILCVCLRCCTQAGSNAPARARAAAGDANLLVGPLLGHSLYLAPGPNSASLRVQPVRTGILISLWKCCSPGLGLVAKIKKHYIFWQIAVVKHAALTAVSMTGIFRAPQLRQNVPYSCDLIMDVHGALVPQSTLTWFAAPQSLKYSHTFLAYNVDSNDSQWGN